MVQRDGDSVRPGACQTATQPLELPQNRALSGRRGHGTVREL